MTIPDPEITQAEKRRVLENDRKVREQATFKSFADASFGNEATRSGGRFSKLDDTPVVKRLPESSPWSGLQPGPGDEPSLDEAEKQAATLAYMRQVAEADLARLVGSVPAPATPSSAVETDRRGEDQPPCSAPTFPSEEK
jgi:hypothetical protein